MNTRPPKFPPSDPARLRDAHDAFSAATRQFIMQAVAVGWRESEAAMALADAADNYVMYLATRPQRDYIAANSN